MDSVATHTTEVATVAKTLFSVKNDGSFGGIGGTMGTILYSGTLNAGQQSPAEYKNANYFAGNGKVSITVCSMHTDGGDGHGTVNSHHVYKVFWNAHGQSYNHYQTPMLQHLADGDLSLNCLNYSPCGCVFHNDSSQTAYWVIKQLPITTYLSTKAAAAG